MKTYPPDETMTYPLDRLDLTVVVVGAVLIIATLIHHFINKENKHQ